MEPAARVARVLSLFRALNGHDGERCLEFFAAGATRSRGDGTSLRGRDNLAARLKSFLSTFPDASITATRVLPVEPRAVVVEWLLEGTHLGELRVADREPIPPSCRRVRVVGADLLRFDSEGRIESDEARVDAAAMLAQLTGGPSPSPQAIHSLAERYTEAWCSQNPASVAAFYAPNGSLRVNAGTPAVGRGAITEEARGFMTAFPDMKVLMDDLLVQGDSAVYTWTLVGTNTGPDGSGHRVRISGFEVWRIGADGLIAESMGHFDSDAYQRQIERGADGL
jgi:predicted ester cyclase